MAFEISNAKRERDFYLKQVNQSKGIKAMQERKRKRGEEAGEAGQEQADDAGDGPQQAAARLPAAGGQARPRHRRGPRALQLHPQYDCRGKEAEEETR